jgi:hypothetical protein
MKDAIDVAFGKLQAIANEIEKYSATIASESDTRLKVIDRILKEVLGWPVADISTSERAGTGFTDYVLRIGQSSRVVLEAKKEGISFELENRQSGQAYKLNGPVFGAGAKEAIEQSIGYNAYKNAELACASNGREWIVFRANRLGDGQDTMEGKAFIFSSLKGILDNFPIFYDLLSFQAVNDLRYRGLFQEVEGLPIRDLSFFKALRPPESRHLLARGEFAADFDAIMSSFFQRLKGDEDAEMIQKCFVVTPESRLAEQKLSRIAEDVVSKLRGLNAGTGEQLVELIKSVQQQHRNRFVLLIGNKGAGKSTFLDRFFKFVLPGDIAGGLVTIRLDVGLSEGDAKRIVPWLNDHLLAAAESAVFADNSRTWDDFVGAVFFDEYQRWSQVTMRHLYETDKNQFKVEFGRHIEDIRKSRPHDFIKRLLHDIVCSRKKVPCIILDNTDHFTIEFQEAVFQYARSIYESDLSIFLIPITDKTSWQLSKQGALQSFESEALYLPMPSAERIIERRISYLFEKLQAGDETQRHEYFFGRGIRLDVKNIAAFAVSLNKIFVETRTTSDWLGGLANFDIRRMLELTRDVISSPHLPIEELLKAHLTGTAMAVHEWKIRSAIIKRKYDIYPVDEHAFVQNMYALSTDIPTTPLLGIRILQLLRDAQLRVSEEDRAFAPVSAIYEHFNALGIHARVVTPRLEALLRTGLVLDYDPTVKNVSDTSRFEISSAGKVHLIWGSTERDYVSAMKEVTPVREMETFEQLRQHYRAGYAEHWRDSLATFIDYLLEEDARWCVVPDHRHFEGQKRVRRRLSIMRERLFSSRFPDNF